ncbi:hypothetical protein ACIF80_36005 [Streptomyces sp. NPDC085927]|uniref:hypothetical protein n=1 Tax=Streptomyces sp. NPDC085927 TaxID=3365738 RepID=UPI0037D7F0FE
MQSNKDLGGVDRWMTQAIAYMRRYLRKWPTSYARTVHDQMISGASYALGSGAVSVIILWLEARR